MHIIHYTASVKTDHVDAYTVHIQQTDMYHKKTKKASYETQWSISNVINVAYVSLDVIRNK